jgi:biopolymer transport protein ExbB/TolQ
MKSTILKSAITGVIVIASFTAFAQQNKKASKARKGVSEAQKDLREAKTDSAADYLRFRKEADINIRENQKKIDELKAKKSNENAELKEKYDKKVALLEQKNNDMRKKLEGSESTASSMWGSFKREFSHDMSELGYAIKDIGVDNSK